MALALPMTDMPVSVAVASETDACRSDPPLPAAPPPPPTDASAAAPTADVDAMRTKRAAMVASVVAARKAQALADKAAAGIKDRRALLDAMFGGEIDSGKLEKQRQTGDNKVKEAKLQENFGQTKFIKP